MHSLTKVFPLVVLVLVVALVLSPVRRDYRPGIMIAIATIAAVDGLPGPDLTSHIFKFGFYYQDIAVFLLVGLLVWEIHTARLWGFYSYGIGRALLFFALLTTGWWFFTLYRTTSVPGIAVNHAANFGRQFMYAAVLTPLFAGAMQRPQTRKVIFVVIGAWSIVLSGAIIFGALHPGSLTSTLLHVSKVRQSGTAVTRLYVPAADLITVVLMFGWAFLLTARAKRERQFAAVVTLFALVAVAMLETRALYFGCAGGMIVAAAAYLRLRDWRTVVRRLGIAVVACAVVILGLYAIAPQVQVTHALGQIATRAASSVGAAGSSNQVTSTVAVREFELQLLEQRLGGSYMLGLGFIDPRDQFDPNLPFGTIENSDVGLFNVVMTMGVVGTVLYYLSLIVTTVMLIVRSRAIPDEERGYAAGALGACALTLITSLTLVSFFGLTGVDTVTAAIGVGAAVVAGRPPMRSRADTLAALEAPGTAPGVFSA